MRTFERKTTEMDSEADPTICSVHGIKFEFEWSWGRLVKQSCAGCEDDQQRSNQLAREHRRIENEREYASVRWAQKQQVAEIPSSYRHASMGALLRETPAQREVAECAQQFIDSEGRTPTNLSLLGPPGTGKTFAAVAIANAFLEREKSVSFFDCIDDLTGRIRSTWHRQSKRSEEQVVRALAEVHLLVIDEVGVQLDSERDLVLLSRIVNARYNRAKPTVVIGNLSPRELSSVLGERVMARLQHGGATLILTGKDLREQFSGPNT